MKNLFSKRIGAILTAVAMLAALLPVAVPVMAEGETVTNLITNGDFSQTYTLTEAVTYTGTATPASGYSATVVFEAGHVLPADWEIVAGAAISVSNTDSARKDQVLASNGKAVLQGSNFSIAQNVKNLVPGTNYTLSFDMEIKTRGAVTIEYLSYDAVSDTFSSLSTPVSETKIYGRTADIAEVFNFVVPSGANAAKISFRADGTGNHSNFRTNLDNVILTQGNELVTGGAFNYLYNGNSYLWSRSSTANVTFSTDMGDYAAKIAAANSNLYQNLFVVPGKIYKLSFKYAQTGRADGEDMAPYVTLAYTNAPSGTENPTLTSKTATNDGQWNNIEIYFRAPEIYADGYDAAAAKLLLGTPATFTGTAYYDDISIQETTLDAVDTESNVNLINNSGFSAYYELTEDKTYTYSSTGYTVTHTAGTKYPAAWEVYYGGAALAAGSGANKTDVLYGVNSSNDAYISFRGTPFSVRQNVKGLEPGQPYNLTYTCEYTALRSTATVTFMHYDEETKTYTELETWAAANGVELLSGRMLEGASTKNVTSVTATYYGTGERGSLNFVLPPYANAVRVSLAASGISANQACNIDDVVLTKTDEHVSNGSFDTYTGTTVNMWWQTPNTTAAAPATSDNPAMTIAAATSSTFPTQRFLAEIGKVYKVSFKYAYSGLPEGSANQAPYVEISYFNNPNVSKHIDTYVAKQHTEGEWTTYEAYFVLPVVDGWAYDIVNVNASFRTRNGEANWTDGTSVVYYDDLSITQADYSTTMGFMENTNSGEFITTPETAKAASLIYVQEKDNATRKFIVAKYNKADNTFISAELVTAGAELKAGMAGNYDVKLDAYDANVYYKIYLWDGNTLVSVANPQQLN